MQPQCIQRKKFIHLQVIRPGKDTRRYTAALGPAIANRIRICSHEKAIVSSLNAVWQPSWPSNKHAAGEILLEIVPGSHNCGRGEKKKNPHLSATQPKHVHRKQSQGFFSRLENCPREKSVPSCRSSNRQKLDQGNLNRRGSRIGGRETPAVGSQGKRNSPFELTNVE